MQKVRLMKYKKTKKNFQPNIITASRQEMTVYERRLFALILNQIRGFKEIQQNESLVFEIPIKEVTGSGLIPYRAIKETAHSLQRKNIFTETEQKEQFSSHIIFPTISYNESKNGIIKIELNKYLVPYFIELGNQYISYDLDIYLALSSVFSQRLYEILLMYILRQKSNKIFQIQVSYLQGRLGCDYPDFYDFKRRVLEPAKKELLKKAALDFDYTISKKEGKKVVELQFLVKQYKDKREEKSLPQPKNDYEVSLEYYLSQDVHTQREMTIQTLDKYKLTKKQKEKVLLSKEHTLKFIEIHLKIESGLITVEKPSAYIAAALK